MALPVGKAIATSSTEIGWAFVLARSENSTFGDFKLAPAKNLVRNLSRVIGQPLAEHSRSPEPRGRQPLTAFPHVRVASVSTCTTVMSSGECCAFLVSKFRIWAPHTDELLFRRKIKKLTAQPHELGRL